MSKTTIMLVGIAAVFVGGIACFGVFSRSDAPPAATKSCAGLEGQAKIDCERQAEKE